jgi:hypothetical protein
MTVNIVSSTRITGTKKMPIAISPIQGIAQRALQSFVDAFMSGGKVIAGLLLTEAVFPGASLSTQAVAAFSFGFALELISSVFRRLFSTGG